MSFREAWIATGLVFAVGMSPALAADWGGVKDMGGGVPVPVPAPAPVPTYDADSDWYVGLAIGANLSQDATIKDSDINMPVKDSSDIGASPIFGLSFGRYITPSLRAEIAIDYNRGSTIADPRGSYSDSLTGASSFSYTDPVTSLSVPTFDTSNYTVLRTDTVRLSRTTGLFNLLYDIDTGTRFKPYIGGGVGFTWRQMKRNYRETATCTQSTNSSAGLQDGLNYPAGYCVDTTAVPKTYTTSGSTTKDQFDFAAAVQAGIGYEINDWITWDNGWQMLWESNAIATSAPSVSGENRITYSDSVIQQFRSGIRVKFN